MPKLPNFLREFCEKTTIHGFRYTVDKRSHSTEKAFWITSLVISLVLTSLLINQLVLKIMNNPFIIYSDDQAIKVTDIVFPAVSLCPPLFLEYDEKLGEFEYEEFLEFFQENDTEIYKLPMEDYEYLQVISLLYGDLDDFLLSFNFGIPTKDIVKRMFDFPSFYGDSKEVYEYAFMEWVQDQKAPLIKIISHSGPCYTFNWNAKKVFKEAISDDFWFSEKLLINNHRLLRSFAEVDYEKNLVKTTNYDLGLQGIFNYRDYLYHHADVLNGFEVVFHDPREMPSKQLQRYNALFNHSVIFYINPVIEQIDDSMLDFSSEDRGCYLDGEYELRFFKKYTQQNCEDELRAMETRRKCSCNTFYEVRDKDDRICGIRDAKCVKEVEVDQLSIRKKCLKPCDNIKYDVEFVINDKDWFFKNEATFIAKFRSPVVYPIKSKKYMNIVEILSFVGGLLGLFAGISFITTAELVYFTLFKLIKVRVNKKKSQKIHPLSLANLRRKKKPIFMKQLAFSYLENSSIHSLNLIITEKLKIQRLFWILIFFASTAAFYLMFEGTYEKFNLRTITLSRSPASAKVESIPFPAVTVIPPIFRKWSALYDPNSDDVKADSQYHNYLNYSNPFHLWNTIHWQICYITKNTNAEVVEYFGYYETLISLKFRSPGDFLENLKRRHLKYYLEWLNNSYIVWNEVHKPELATILVRQGVGFSFNMRQANDLLHLEKVHSDFNYDSKQNPIFRATGYPNKGLKMKFDEPLLPRYHYMCIQAGVKVHSPSEFAIYEKNDLSKMYTGGAMELLITPEVIKSDESLRSIEPEIRQCYFEDERKLEFFKIYTQKNCELECLSAISYHECKCTLFYLVRNSTMEVCNAFEQNCAYYVRMVNYVKNSCGHCLPLCNDVKYNTEVRIFEVHQDYDATAWNSTSIEVRYKEEEFYPLQRYEAFTLKDFLSNVGGLMGLFAGVSILSIFEIFYFFTIRILGDFYSTWKKK